jgi:hypothetical protein
MSAELDAHPSLRRRAAWRTSVGAASATRSRKSGVDAKTVFLLDGDDVIVEWLTAALRLDFWPWKPDADK